MLSPKTQFFKIFKTFMLETYNLYLLYCIILWSAVFSFVYHMLVNKFIVCESAI